MPIPTALRDILIAELLRTGRRGDELIFGSSGSAPFSPTTLTARARKAWDPAGLQRITLHECRHTFASLMIAAGVNAKALSSYMGHASIQITFDRYGHSMSGSEEQAAGAARRLSAILLQGLTSRRFVEIDAPHPKLLERYRGEFDSCLELLAFSRSKLETWSGRPLEPGTVDVILAAEAGRATKTFRAGLLLCAAGFGQQALMLCRGLFEGMLIAHWAVEDPNETLSRFQKHSDHTRMLWSDKLTELGWIGEEEAVEASPQERAELDELFGRYGERAWTGRSAYSLMQAVQGQWQDGGKQLREFFSVVYRESNLILHSTAWGLERTLSQRDSGSVSFESGPSDQYVGQALFALFWIYVQTLSLLIDHFEVPGREVLEDIHVRGHRRFHRLSEEVTRETGRNDPCPCGSGEKFKHCHGR